MFLPSTKTLTQPQRPAAFYHSSSSTSVLPPQVCLDSLPSVMSAVTSRLSKHQHKMLLSLLGHVRLHLLYKASIHGFTAVAFHNRCDKQGPTVIVAYNAAGFVFGAYTSKDYTQSEHNVSDEEAFLYSINAEGTKTLRVAGIGRECAFTDGKNGPDYGALVFLCENKPEIKSAPGTRFNFQNAELHGEDLTLTEFEVYRVEGFGDLLAQTLEECPVDCGACRRNDETHLKVVTQVILDQRTKCPNPKCNALICNCLKFINWCPLLLNGDTFYQSCHLTLL